jgi:oxygen-dependent protoporphyrinogen oxidase
MGSRRRKVAIVGGGISGLTAGFYLQREFEVTIFEKEKWGGKAFTRKVGEYLFEEGVNGFLNNTPETLQLCEDVGIEPIPANENSKKRFIYDRGRLYQLPNSPLEFLTSPILSWRGKIRVAGEFFVSRNCKDETIEEFALRRLGKEFTRRFITPMVAGIYGATPAQLSVSNAFPRIKEVECKYGSLIKGMIKLGKGGTPAGELHSFPRGVSQLVEGIISKTSGNFVLKEIESLEELKGFDEVILATPAYATGEILKKYPRISKLLKSIPYNPIGVVGLDYEKIEPEGFGILTADSPTLGVLMDKYIFPARNGVRVMVGGGRFPEIAQKSLEEVIEMGEKGVAEITGATKPKIRWGVLHKNGIPVYGLHHRELVAQIEEEALKIGVHLLGNWKGGVSFNDCIRNGKRLAEKLIAQYRKGGR